MCSSEVTPHGRHSLVTIHIESEDIMMIGDSGYTTNVIAVEMFLSHIKKHKDIPVCKTNCTIRSYGTLKPLPVAG